MRVELKARMKERNVKVPDIAKVANISISFSYKIVADTRNPTMGQAKKIADFLEDSVDHLFFGTALDKLSNEQSTALDPTGTD
jgi:predicted transcriptional regulator